MKRTLSGLLICCLLLSLFAVPVQANAGDISSAAEMAQGFLVQTKPILDETDAWLVIAAARAGQELPKGYAVPFAARLGEKLRETDGVLRENRAGENAYAALALAAIGEDPENFAGYNVLAPLLDEALVLKDGVTGTAYALLALQSSQTDAAQHAKDVYAAYLLEAQNEDGGWSSGNLPSDASVTAIVLQALAPQRRNETAGAAISRALDCLSQMQEDGGGFSAKGVLSASALAQVILTLCALDVSPQDSRFMKNGRTALDALLAEQKADGSFQSIEPASDLVTALSLLALSAVQRAQDGQNSVFDMTDAQPLLEAVQPEPFVSARQMEKQGVAFTDTKEHAYRQAIETLAAYGVIGGKGDGTFSPDETMTRAQFAKIVTDGLGLAPEYRGTFTDVAEDAWYAGAVDTAAAYGIVTGTGDGTFLPESAITRQEAIAMLTRAAKLCGFDPALFERQISRVLSTFSDGGAVSDYARGAVAFCAQYALLPKNWAALKPSREITRGEVAQMLCSLLSQAGLLQ